MHRSMRIAIVAPPWFEVPPSSYGGIEAMCDTLAVGLQRRGHDVVLLSAGTRHRTVWTETIWPELPTGLGLPEGGMVELAYAAEVANALDRIAPEVIHDHTAAGPLLSRARSTPTVVTVHGPVDSHGAGLLRSLGTAVHAIAISDAQRIDEPRINWIDTIHNGISVSSFPFRADKEPYLVFLGRMHPNKGVHVAIDVAREVGLPIVIAAKCSEPHERAYFEEQVRPRLGDDAEYVGEADAGRKRELLSGARALLFPIQWEEPFGLVMVEALACGTPVVALRRGSVDEVVTDGVTGFIRDDASELADAIRALDTIDPVACRRDAERRFDDGVMVRRYESAYARVIEDRRRTAPTMLDAVS
jgi:glycosyltransferase involved in cell wall biosynthesis